MFKWLSKILIVTIITLITLILIKTNSDIKNVIYDNVYNTNINFAKLNKLYKKYFGDSKFLDNKLNSVPVFNEKLIYSKKEKIDNYLKLSVDNDYLVPSLETGLVIFTGVKENFGNVVIIQQVDGVDIWYGNLTNINVKLYDYVDKGTLIGSCNNVLYLVHKKDGEFLNYEDKI